MSRALTAQEYVGWLRLLAESLDALAAEGDPRWTKLSLRNWGGVADHYPLVALETVWEVPQDAKDRAGYHLVPDTDLRLLASALRDAAFAVLDDPSKQAGLAIATSMVAAGLGKKTYALGLSDRDTEYNGVFVLFRLHDLLDARLAPVAGVLARLDKDLAHLEFRYHGKPVDDATLADLASRT